MGDNAIHKKKEREEKMEQCMLVGDIGWLVRVAATIQHGVPVSGQSFFLRADPTDLP